MNFINNPYLNYFPSYNQGKQVPAQKPVVQAAVNSIQNPITILQPAVSAQTPTVKQVTATLPIQLNKPKENVEWKNDLRQLFNTNKAVVYAMVVRTFNAKDKDGDGLIDTDKGEVRGNFINAIDRLDELKSLGINTLHMLPILPPAKKGAMGLAGCVYAPSTYTDIDPALRDPNHPGDVYEQAKKFIDEAHKRNIRVMIDVPSCASIEFAKKNPEMIAVNPDGSPKVPQGWDDIRAFKVWEDEEKRILNKPLLNMHKEFIDMIKFIGADGIRADVARYKPPEFWQEFFKYAREGDPQAMKSDKPWDWRKNYNPEVDKKPWHSEKGKPDKNFGGLAEGYTYEDASPMANIPADRPESQLKSGFDLIYGQYHIFPSWLEAKQLHGYIKEITDMSHRLPPNKGLIGSFATHDDKAPFSNGGVVYSNLSTGIQATLPMTNPYFVSGFESGDDYIYPYRNKYIGKTETDSNIAFAHPEWIDIFNYSKKPDGKHPEIGEYMSKVFKVRKKHEDVITKGSYIPMNVKGNPDDKIISYARHHNGKTLLVVANRNVNGHETGKIEIPTMKKTQKLTDLSPSYGLPSRIKVANEGLEVDLGPGRFHLFEINTPDIEKYSKEIYKPNQKFEETPKTRVKTLNNVYNNYNNALSCYYALKAGSKKS